MKCPRCGSQMTMGAPHVPGPVIQWECHQCGKVVVVSAARAVLAETGDK